VNRRVLAGGRVVDGGGGPAAHADVWIEGERIERVTPAADHHGDWPVESVVGLVVAPGFIDVHSHADHSPFLADADTTKILQGVTTEVVGNCGSSLLSGGPRRQDRRAVTGLLSGEGLVDLDPKEYMARLGEARPVTHQAVLVGHGTIRAGTVGLDARPASAAERREMRAVLAECLDLGAFGLSSGLFYAPGSYADASELSDLAQALRGRAAVYASHIRNEGPGLLAAVDEFLEVGRRAGVRLELSHHKAAGLAHWGMTRDSLALIGEARAAGVAVALDVYPYTASSTHVSACLPRWVQDGGPAACLDRLADPALRERIRHDTEQPADWESMVAYTGYDRLVLATAPDPAWEGRSLADLATAWGTSPFDAMVRVLTDSRLEATMVVHGIAEEDLVRALGDPHCAIGSDGLPPEQGGRPHPRLTGTFPRVLGRYARDLGVLTLEEAVRRMTGLPAAWFGIPDRGRVLPGRIADLVVFDPKVVQDGSTFEDPWRPPVGIQSVWQRGEAVVRENRFLDRRGVVLRPSERDFAAAT
jgi:N-acyl-D-amino-acid deacylase